MNGIQWIVAILLSYPIFGRAVANMEFHCVARRGKDNDAIDAWAWRNFTQQENSK